jgi:hypothetical protein
MAPINHPPAPDTSQPSPEPAPVLNLSEMVAPLLGRTFDLRRLYEQKLCLLTELQGEIDVVRSPQTPFPRRRQGMENLVVRFSELAKSTEEAAELLKQIREQFSDIHQESHEIEREQRER